MDPLAAVDQWPVGEAAVAVVRAGEVQATRGPMDRSFRLASVTKLLSALTVLVAVEEGTVALGDPAGPEGSTVAHLLAHASGLGMDGARLTTPGRRRIYSNAGFDLLGWLVAERSGMPFATYASEAVFEPLGMQSTSISGSPAWKASSTAADLCAFAQELLRPTLVSEKTLAEATSVTFAGLKGIVPGFGRQDPNDWGLGFEIRGQKSPHWTGTRNSPGTFGHFGKFGTFLWVDPEVPGGGLGLVGLTDREFGPWAAEAWPALSDEVLAAYV